MCGIAALFEPGRHFEPGLLNAIDEDLFHRGPDSGGSLSESGWAVVFRRLAILDPTAKADQPMTDPSGRCSLVFNGEIYNYQKLRTELKQHNVRLRTEGDTEVVLEGYLLWGEAILDRLEGMFAFSLVDRKRGVALAARDPLGIKPLYMTRRGSMTAFASEVRPLLRLVPPRVNQAALSELITFGWAAGRLSNYEDVERIPGGTLVTVQLASGQIQERRYCDPLDTLCPDEAISAGEVSEKLEEAITNSLSAHLASDVGYSVQLSGGIDSSLIGALAASRTDGRMSSYSVSLGAHEYDESSYQRMVAERYNLDHQCFVVGAKDYVDALPRAVRHMEGPTPHGGCVLLMLLCDRIRERSKVVLTGEGADEMFGGYQRYQNWRKLMWQERLGRVLPTQRLPSHWPFAGIRRFANLDAASYASVYHDFQMVQQIFPGLVPEPGARQVASDRFLDQSAYLESLLIRQDKMSMAASVEARVPFVHMPLLRVVNQLPRDIRTPGGVTKPLLKKMAASFLPKEVIHRRKIGLWLPYHEWFSDPNGAGIYLEALTASDSRLSQYAEGRRLTEYVERFRKNASRNAGLIMQRLVELELWLRSVPQYTGA
jgi:asparagine synthase (glutamine-hydrolysing)